MDLRSGKKVDSSEEGSNRGGEEQEEYPIVEEGYMSREERILGENEHQRGIEEEGPTLDEIEMNAENPEESRGQGDEEIKQENLSMIMQMLITMQKDNQKMKEDLQKDNQKLQENSQKMKEDLQKDNQKLQENSQKMKEDLQTDNQKLQENSNRMEKRIGDKMDKMEQIITKKLEGLFAKQIEECKLEIQKEHVELQKQVQQVEKNMNIMEIGVNEMIIGITRREDKIEEKQQEMENKLEEVEKKLENQNIQIENKLKQNMDKREEEMEERVIVRMEEGMQEINNEIRKIQIEAKTTDGQEGIMNYEHPYISEANNSGVELNFYGNFKELHPKVFLEKIKWKTEEVIKMRGECKEFKKNKKLKYKDFERSKNLIENCLIEEVNCWWNRKKRVHRKRIRLK